MKTPVKVTLVTTAVAVVLLVGALIFVLVNQSQASSPEGGAGSPQVVRENSHVLDDAGKDAVTVVEFLDFECEACGAFYPIVEDVRTRFAGDITYVVRYFGPSGPHQLTQRGDRSGSSRATGPVRGHVPPAVRNAGRVG